MRVRGLTLLALTAVIGLGAAAPAFADDDWRWHERREWREQERREHAWREHEWRERAWREHEWREHQRAYAPPPYGWNGGYYR